MSGVIKPNKKPIIKHVIFGGRGFFDNAEHTTTPNCE